MTSKHEFIDKYLADSEYAQNLAGYIATQPLRKKVSDAVLMGVVQRLILRGMVTEPEFPVITRASVVTTEQTVVNVALQLGTDGKTVDVTVQLENWIEELKAVNDHETLTEFAKEVIYQIAEVYYV